MTDLQNRIAALPPDKRALLEDRLAELTAARASAQTVRIPARDRSLPAPLATAQRREWAIERVRAANNITGAFRVEGELDPVLLGRVLSEVVQRHEVLRSTVEILPDGMPAQVVHPVTEVPVPVVDLSHLDADRQREEILARGKADISRRFDPTDPLRLRITLLRLAAETHVALFCNDHAAADAWSLAIIVREVAALYDKHRNGGPGLPPPEIQFADFAAWQREQYDDERTAAEVRHWQDTLAGIPAGPAMPADRPSPARPTFAGDVFTVELPAALSADLARFSSREGSSLVMVVLAATSILLHRLREQPDLVIGSLVSGRTRVETEQLVGCFTNPLPLRMTLREDETLREVVRRARVTMATALDHQDVPFDRLVEALGLGREASQTSLSRMWINVLTVPDMTLELPGLRISAEPMDMGLASVDLTLTVAPQPHCLQLQWQYMTEIFDVDTVRLLAGHFETVLRRIVGEPDTTVGQVHLADDPHPVPGVRTAGSDIGIVELFERRAALAPYSTAVVCDGRPTSYAELDREADRLARHLRALGVGPEVPVGVLVDRSPRLAVAILGVLKAGGAFVPLDPAYPAERIAFMLADARARVLLTEQRPAGVLAQAGAALPPEVLVLDDGSVPADPGTGAELPHPAPDSLAYAIYTSGSTGRPKGVMIEHRSLSTFALDIVDRLGLGSGDRFLQFASTGFDVLVEELFPTWVAGGAVVISTRHIVSGEIPLADLIERERLTVIELPTAYWHEWVRELDRTGRELPGSLRLVIIGGERVLPERLALWRRQNVPLAHVYGLTETTVSSTFFRLDPADPGYEWANLPIGSPVPSADLRILDSRLQPVPRGGMGELYIGGTSVARGYLHRPGLTAHRFVADPHPACPGRRLYRTGDLVRRRADGNLEFLSRVDTQIKIRGFRVEPTEVESALGRHPHVADSVVVVHEPAAGDRRLAAYVVPVAGAAVNGTELRRHLERELPPYMVPATFVELDALPHSPNGKIARDRLPPPDGVRPEQDKGYVAARTPAEKQLADIVSAVVGVARIGVEDNFFEVGGDSILAIQVVARAQEAGLRLTPYDLFANPTVASLAEVVTAGSTVDAEQGDVAGPLTLTAMQRWFSTAGIAQPQHWNRSVLLELPDPVPPDVLRAAVQRVLVHHDGLRQRFLLAGERTRARIAPVGDETPFEVCDLSGLADAELDGRTRQVAAGMHTNLDPAVGPLVRVALLQLGDARPDRLVVVAHRLVVDAESLRLVLQDLETAVVQLSEGEELRFLPKTTSWQSWCRRLGRYAASEELEAQRGYWTELVARPAARLPVDAPAGSPDGDGDDTVAAARSVTVTVDPAETDALLRTVPRALACGVEDLLLTALGRTLSGWSGATRHLVDLERHDREQLFDDVDLRRTVGWFSRTHPVELTCAPDGAPEEALRSVKEALRAVPAGGIGWQLLRQGADPVPDPAVELAVTYLDPALAPAPRLLPVLAGSVGEDRSPQGRRPYAMEVEASVGDDGALQVRWSYGEGRHRRETVQGLADGLVAQLRELIELSRGDHRAAPAPADFPFARIDQDQLSELLGRL